MAKLLIIDDDKDTCGYIKKFFEKRKCVVLAAHSGKEGLELYGKERPDIVLLDKKMPDMDGLDVLKEIKQMDSRARVIMITVASDDETKRKAAQLGVDDLIKKPLNTSYLEGTVSLKVAMLTKERKKVINEPS